VIDGRWRNLTSMPIGNGIYLEKRKEADLKKRVSEKRTIRISGRAAIRLGNQEEDGAALGGEPSTACWKKKEDSSDFQRTVSEGRPLKKGSLISDLTVSERNAEEREKECFVKQSVSVLKKTAI